MTPFQAWSGLMSSGRDLLNRRAAGERSRSLYNDCGTWVGRAQTFYQTQAEQLEAERGPNYIDSLGEVYDRVVGLRNEVEMNGLLSPFQAGAESFNEDVRKRTSNILGLEGTIAIVIIAIVLLVNKLR